MNNPSLRRTLAEYCEHLTAKRFSPFTVRQNRSGIGLFIRWLEDVEGIVRADRLRRTHLEHWQRHVAETTFRGRPIKARSINKRIETVRNLLRYLGERGYVARHLEAVVEYVKEPKVLPGSVLNHEQVRRLLDGLATDTPVGYRNRTLLELLYTTGIRAGELVGLDVGSLDLPNGTARVMGKGQKERTVPIGRTALAMVETYLNGVRSFLVRESGQNALFLDEQGGRFPYHGLLRLVHAVAPRTRIGVNVTPHTFRRSCTTELLRSGAGMYHVKELLGHESLDTLQHYAKLTIHDLKKEHQRCHPRERDAHGEGPEKTVDPRRPMDDYTPVTSEDLLPT